MSTGVFVYLMFVGIAIFVAIFVGAIVASQEKEMQKRYGDDWRDEDR